MKGVYVENLVSNETRRRCSRDGYGGGLTRIQGGRCRNHRYLPAGWHRLRTAPMTRHPCGAVVRRIRGTTRVRRARRVGIEREVVRLLLVGVVTQREGKNRRRMRRPNVGIFLTQIVLRVGVVGRLQQDLKAVVARRGGRGPWHRGIGGTICTSLHA
jgi:hypothetical protein